MAAETLIGIDIGTTSLKAGLFDRDGALLAETSASYGVDRPRPGWAEQDPELWLRGARAALETLAGSARAGAVRAVGVTSQVNTHLFVDAQMRPLGPAILWQDLRATEAAARLDAEIGDADKRAWFGAAAPIPASSALARCAWAAAEAPATWKRTAQVLAPKDYVLAELTGRAVADPISAVGLVGEDLDYVAPFLAAVPGAGERTPPLADPLEGAGVVRAGLPAAGAPVAVGTMDAWAAMFGVGAARDGDAMYLSGTSEVVGLISSERHPAAGVVSFPDWRGITLHAGPTQAGGAALAWACGFFGREVGDLLALAAAERIDAQSPLFLPHLAGERAPIWDASARGTFAGLRADHGPGAAALAVLEGVAFSARWVLEAVEAAGGRRAEVLRAGGGGMRSDLWAQVRADALGRPLARAAGPEAAARGAALMAGVSAGLWPDLAAAASDWARTAETFTPDPRAAALAERRFGAFRALYEAMRPVNAALSQACPS